MSAHDHHDDPRESDILAALLYREVDHHGPQAEAVHRLRKKVQRHLTDLVHDLHDARALAAGQQWTIPIGLSCGFEGQLVIRISDPGPDHGARRHSR